MSWLVDLIQSSSGSLDLLPVQCLCEFLLLESDDKDKEHGHKRDARAKKEQVDNLVLIMREYCHCTVSRIY